MLDFLPLVEGLRELVLLLSVDGRRIGVAMPAAPAPVPGLIGFLMDFHPVEKSSTSA